MTEKSILLSSKDILLKTGISRATLNNYIKMGILSRPIVQTPLDGLKRPRKLGYFPPESLAIIERVQYLKSEGLSMTAISDQMRKFKPLEAARDGGKENRRGRKEDTRSLSLFPEPDVPGSLRRIGKAETSRGRTRPTGAPALLHHCVLHVSLENRKRLSDETPPEDFLLFIEKTWGEFEALCTSHGGFCRLGESFVAIFIGSGNDSWLKKVLNAAIRVRNLSGRNRDFWTAGCLSSRDVSLKCGLALAEEYSVMLGGSPERMVLARGCAVEEACLLSQHAQGGALWVSKNLLCRLAAEERQAYRYGIREGEAFQDRKFICIAGDSLLPSDIFAAELPR